MSCAGKIQCVMSIFFYICGDEVTEILLRFFRQLGCLSGMILGFKKAQGCHDFLEVFSVCYSIGYMKEMLELTMIRIALFLFSVTMGFSYVSF